MKKLRCLLFFLLISKVALADYTKAILYFNDGDSIEGFAKIFGNSVKFKVSEDENADIWDHISISGVEIFDTASHTKYEYVNLSNKKEPRLLEILEKGAVSLYKRDNKIFRTRDGGVNTTSFHDRVTGVNREISSYTGTFDKKIDYFFIRTSEEIATCVNCVKLNPFGDSWRKRTAKYFSDCEYLAEKIMKRKYSEYDMLEIAQYYNDLCVEY